MPASIKAGAVRPGLLPSEARGRAKSVTPTVTAAPGLPRRSELHRDRHGPIGPGDPFVRRIAERRAGSLGFSHRKIPRLTQFPRRSVMEISFAPGLHARHPSPNRLAFRNWRPGTVDSLALARDGHCSARHGDRGRNVCGELELRVSRRLPTNCRCGPRQDDTVGCYVRRAAWATGAARQKLG